MERRRRRRRRRRRTSPVIFIVLLIVVLIGVFGIKTVLSRYSYSKVQEDLDTYFGVQADNDVPIIWGDELSDVHAKIFDGVYYMDLDSVREKLNPRFYYGTEDTSDTTGMIIYALPTEKMTTVIGSQDVTGDQSGTQTMSYVPARREGDTIYLAMEFVKQYTNFYYATFTDPNRMQIYSEWPERTVATIAKKTAVRTTGGIKSNVLTRVAKGDKVFVLEKMETWSKVRTEDGFIGYVENKRLKDETTETMEPVTDYQEPEYTTKKLDGKVNMGWHVVWGAQGNITLDDVISQTKTVNVVAPTWFWVTDDEGDTISAAEQSYVDQVHAMGKQVWAVVDNFNSEGVDHNNFLETLERRSNVIDTVINEALTYGIDGINVDFELIDSDHGQDFVEFIREISIACRNNGLTLSVDNYVPYEFNDYYDLREQGVFADYVVIMGYDEHYAGGDAGSVASIGYVTNGIQSALTKVPADKLINAVPFYTRIWTTTSAGTESMAVGMPEAQQFIANHGMTQAWSNDDGQNYAESYDGTTKYQIWVEDAQSIETKLSVMSANDLAGVAEWRLGYETADIWDVIANYMNQ